MMYIKMDVIFVIIYILNDKVVVYSIFVVLMDFKTLFKKPIHFDKMWFFYVQDFLTGLSSFLGPVIMIYFILIGFNYVENAILFAVWVGSQFIFEIPTGAIADIHGRKLSVFLSYFFGGVLAILLGASSSFYVLLVLVFLLGGSTTLSSGADKAWLVDHVKQNGLNRDLQKIISNITSYSSLGHFIALGFSTYLIYLNVRYVWYATGLLFIMLSFFILVYGPENFERKKGITVSGLFRKTYDISRDAMVYVKNHRVLLWIFLGTFIASVNMGVGSYAVQPYLLSLGLPAHMFGPIFMFFAFCGIITPQFSGRFLKILKTEKNLLIFSRILSMLLYLSFYFTGSLIIAVGVFLVFGSIGGVFLPIIMTYTHKHISSEIRATTGSVESMLGSLGMIIGLPIGGLILQYLGFKVAFVCGILLVIVELYFYLRIDDGDKINK